MFRILISGLLALAVAAEASAQSAPAATAAKAPATQTTRKTTTRPTTKTPAGTRAATARRAGAANTTAAPAAGGRDDIGPGGNGAVGSTANADGKGQGVYAAPGMSVKVSDPKNVQGYNGPAPTRAKSRTTLTPR